MKVFKFGGASVATVEKIKQVGEILMQYPAEEIMVIVSAMGKTTNALEKVAEAYYSGRINDAKNLFSTIRNQHFTTAKYLLIKEYLECEKLLNAFCDSAEKLMQEAPDNSFDFYYDQIVSVGELLSTAIVSSYLKEAGITSKFIDVREIIKTDDRYRAASIDWLLTAHHASTIGPLFSSTSIVLTQGFIGRANNGATTTLGREGSDFTAAIFANLLNAESLTIWKDVEGVMNADPKEFSEAELIPELSFEEVIEMAYYGAQVIHPKTIKPLQNKNIPLKVKCFLNPALPGTVIHHKKVCNLPPIYVHKSNQALLHLTTTDFSFAAEKAIEQLFSVFKAIGFIPNLIQTGAITIQICMDDNADKIEEIALSVADTFHINVERDLHLFTIRHYPHDKIETYLSNKEVVLQQRTPSTLQFVYRRPIN